LRGLSYGGLVVTEGSSTLILKFCRILDSMSPLEGGGIHSTSSTVILENVHVVKSVSDS
jgi:hypothetical protein